MIHARGELEASESLAQAAGRLEQHPAALQLRTLSTLAEIAVEKNSTIVFPLPFEVMRVFDAMARVLESSVAPPASLLVDEDDQPATAGATADSGVGDLPNA